MVIPLPLDIYDGGYVMASVWLCDDPGEPAAALLITVYHDTPRYRVVEVIERDGQWVKGYAEDFPNIVPAVDYYKENGGDY